jgi:glycosyltransferase involved in cell wall biosynthesis
MNLDLPPDQAQETADSETAFTLQARAAERPTDPLVSVLLPAFNEQHNVVPMLETLHTLFTGLRMRHELVVIDDGSRDDTVEKVSSVMNRLPVVLIQLSRNFGKEVALSAGIDQASGDVAVLIDCDFQHPPDLIPSFLAQWRRGYDMVYAVRSDRNDESLPKRAFTQAFYWLLNVGERNKIPENTQDFRVLDRCMLDALRRMPERNRFMKGLYNWVGFTRLGMKVRTDPRRHGSSSFNFASLLRLAATGLTAFSNVPLRVWTIVGSLISLISIAYAGYIVIETLFFGNDAKGWPTLVVAVSFLGGVQLLSIGILGEYIGRIFTEVKQRPHYFISRVTRSRAAPSAELNANPGTSPSANPSANSSANDNHV